jgi:hypothetical protein
MSTRRKRRGLPGPHTLVILEKMKRAVLILAAIAFAAGVSPADELRLKDGSKITGVIVGFDENSFKVKTAYGYAIIRRDAVESIVITETPPEATAKPENKPAAPANLPATNSTGVAQTAPTASAPVSTTSFPPAMTDRRQD